MARETIASHIARIERYQPRIEGLLNRNGGIAVSTEFDRVVLTESGMPGVAKQPILWPLFQYSIFMLTEVAAGTALAPHAHDEAVFRLIVSGSMKVKVNNLEHTLTSGMYLIIQENIQYSIFTETGYVALAAYEKPCRRPVGPIPVGPNLFKKIKYIYDNYIAGKLPKGQLFSLFGNKPPK